MNRILLAIIIVTQGCYSNAAQKRSENVLVKSNACAYNAAPHRFQDQPMKYPKKISLGLEYRPTWNREAIRVLTHVSPLNREAVALDRAEREKNHLAQCKAIGSSIVVVAIDKIDYIAMLIGGQDYPNLKWGVEKRL